MLSRLLSYRFCQSVLNKVKNRIKLPLRRGGRYGEVGGNMTPDFLIFVFGTGGRGGGGVKHVYCAKFMLTKANNGSPVMNERFIFN